MSGKTAKEMYNSLKTHRNAFETRAKDASLLTIPQLYPPEGSNGNTRYPNPYQSLGSKGVNNLANKIVLSLFPPNTSFFKLGLSPSDIALLGKSEGDINKAMLQLEKSIINDMEVSSLRPKLVHLIKLLLVGGSGTLYVPPVGMPEVFNLRDFVVKRDKQGNVLTLIIKEEVDKTNLSKQILDQFKIPKEDEQKKCVEVYTLIKRKDDKWMSIHQEINGEKIKGSDGRVKTDELNYIFVPFVDNGEDYGRSYIEDFIGDLQSYEGIRQAILEAAAESARIIYLLKPNSTLSLKKLRDAKSGDVLMGNLDDVGVLQADKRLDLQVTQSEAQTLRQELAMTFLLDSSVQRNAERVTAEEIRRVSQELEIALGGIYSTLSITLQKPLVKVYMNRLVKQGKIPAILKDSLDLEVTTGSSALGRGNDYSNLMQFIQTAVQISQVQSPYISTTEVLSRAAYGLSVNTEKLIRTEEEVQGMMQQQQEAQALQSAIPQVAKAMTDPKNNKE